MATKHRLKSQPGPFMDVWLRVKRHEVRKFDRKFEVGDIVELYEFDTERPEGKQAGGLEVITRITNITPPGSWGLPDDIGVFSFEELARVVPPEVKSEDDIPF